MKQEPAAVVEENIEEQKIVIEVSKSNIEKQ